MLLSLMVYVMTVSLLLGLAAWAFERAVRVFAFPTRWIWAGAMGGSVGYLLMAILRPMASSRPLGTVVATPLDALLIPVVGSITRFADASPSGVGLGTLLGAGWVVLTLAVAAVLVRAHLRLRSDRSSWTPSELDGQDVLVSEDLGPGVVGWIRSVIVMPRWAFSMPPQERELMLQHEGEHCEAGDTRVAGLALLFLTLLPWNVPLWWQVHRLRLAIEIDCDHRVLHRSADVKRYAMLLVEIGARGTASRLSALAFARPIPSIERRILAMTDSRDDPRYIRMIGLSLLAALLVVASCQVEQLSITVEVEQTTPEARADAVDQAERILRTRIDEFGVEEPPRTTPEVEPPPTTEEMERVRAAADTATEEMERLRAAVDAVIAEVRQAVATRPPTDGGRADLAAAPVFTPYTVRPEIRNRTEVQAALMREYPPILRDAGIGGQVVLWLFISETGQVLDRRVSRTSGHVQLDVAALRVADVFRFTPALNSTEPVQVWIELPITFAVN